MKKRSKELEKLFKEWEAKGGRVEYLPTGIAKLAFEDTTEKPAVEKMYDGMGNVYYIDRRRKR